MPSGRIPLNASYPFDRQLARRQSVSCVIARGRASKREDMEQPEQITPLARCMCGNASSIRSRRTQATNRPKFFGTFRQCTPAAEYTTRCVALQLAVRRRSSYNSVQKSYYEIFGCTFGYSGTRRSPNHIHTRSSWMHWSTHITFNLESSPQPPGIYC